MPRKSRLKTLQDDSGLREFASQLVKKYIAGGRTPTLEELRGEFVAWQESSPRPKSPTKSQLKAQKIQRLKEYIDLANKLPPERKALDIEKVMFLDDQPVPPVRTTEYDLRKFRFLLLYLDKPQIPPDFREYILEGVSDEAKAFAASTQVNTQDDTSIPLLSQIYEALHKYEKFREAREKLLEIISLRTQVQPDALRRAVAHWMGLDVASHLYLDSDGILQLSVDSFAETVRGLQADRIRDCPVCGRIFWADRSDKSCCSEPCSNVFNTRRSRKRLSENRKYKRRLVKRKRSVKR